MRLRLADGSEPAPASSAGRGAPVVRALVLLAGSVRANAMRRMTGRPGLRMPVSAGRTVLDCWREQAMALAESAGIANLPVRVVIDQDATIHPERLSVGPVSLSIEQDPADLRGTGGLLRDIACEYGDDDHLLVAHGAQLLFEPLSSLTQRLSSRGADVAIMTCPNGTPAGLMLIRCGAVKGINGVGFVDLNEQALPDIAKNQDVRVVPHDGQGGRSLRTLAGYLGALRDYHERSAGMGAAVEPFAERWRSSFGIVEAGAEVAPDVVLHESVVLDGARIGPGAVVVRSVVCGGVQVEPGAEVIDRVLGPGSGPLPKKLARRKG
ncbi:MAG: hypothetical protein AAF288_13015 [Planctomycetota bacterium]